MNSVSAAVAPAQLQYSISAAIRNIIGDDSEAVQTIVLEGMAASEAQDEAQRSPNTSPGQTTTIAEDEHNLRPPPPIGSPTSMVPQGEPPLGVKWQRDLNRTRELFVSTPIAFAARQRRIEGIIRDFTTHVTSVVEQTFSLMLQSQWWKRRARGSLLVHMGSRAEVVERVQRQLDAGEPHGLNELMEGWLEQDADSFVLDGIEYSLLHTDKNMTGHVEQVQRELLEDFNRRNPQQAAQTTLPEHLHSLSSMLAFERIRKAAHREVKTRRQLLGHHYMETYCQTPLCCAVDFMGLTFMAEAACGFTRQTCQGGLFLSTTDQYRRVFAQGDAVPGNNISAHLQRAISVSCFLKMHPKCGVTGYVPVDLQVQVPSDGTVYLRCSRRMFPPVLALLGGVRPPSTLGATHPLAQQAGCRLKAEFLEVLSDYGGAPTSSSQGLALSPDCWLDEPSRSIDNNDSECLQVNQVLHDKTIPLVGEIIGRLDEMLRLDNVRAPSSQLHSRSPSRTTDARAAASAWLPQFASNFTGATLKSLLHTYGVNLCFLGRIVEWVVGSIAAHTTMNAASAAKYSCSTSSPAPSLVALDSVFLQGHPMIRLLRLEMCSRALRVIVQAEQRRKVALYVTAVVPKKQRRRQSGSHSANDHSPELESLRRVVGEAMCEVMCRCSGELMASQSGDDATFWLNELIPMVQALFGCTIPFTRAGASTSTAPGDSRVLGLSTAARVRTRALRQDEGGEVELRSRPMRLASLEVAPWGHINDARFAHAVPTEAYVMSPAHNFQHSPHSSPQRAQQPQTAIDSRCIVSIEPRRANDVESVRLGACQDYQLTERTCDMLSSIVERRLDSPSGFACRCIPHVVNMESASLPLDAAALTRLVQGEGKQVEQMLLDDMKERKQRSTSGLSADISLLRSYHSLAITSIFRGSLPSAAEWLTKIKEAFSRDLANNDLGQAMTMALSSRLELLRRRSQEATELASHALLIVSDVGHDTQLLPVCMATLLDSLDAGGVTALKGRKSEVARQLVPLCLRYGLPVGRVAAREATHRIHVALLPPKPPVVAMIIDDKRHVVSPMRSRTSPPPSKNRRTNSLSASQLEGATGGVAPPQGPPQYTKRARIVLAKPLLRFLGACCQLMIDENGAIDAEIASVALHLLLWTRDVQFVPLATALLVHSIPSTDSHFRPCCELVSESLHDWLGNVASDGSNVPFRQLLHMLTTHHSTIREPCMLLAYFRQQLATRRLQEAHRHTKDNPLSTASSERVLVRGTSSILATTKKAQSFQRAIHAFAAHQPGESSTIATEVDEDRFELQGYYYLQKDSQLIIGGGDADSVVVHCVLYFMRCFLLQVLDSVPAASRCDPQLWDATAAAAYGDIVNLTKFFSDARLDVAVLLNRMLSSILDEHTLPPGVVNQRSSLCLELFSRDQGNAATPVMQSIVDERGFRLGSADSPVSLVATPFVWFLHDATYLIVGKQMELLGLLDRHARSEHIAEDEPKKGPQLEWVKELFFSCECGLELMAALRMVHRHGSVRDPVQMYTNKKISVNRSPTSDGLSPLSKTTHSLSTIFPFTVAQAAAPVVLTDEASPTLSAPPGMLKCTALDKSHMELVAAIFNPALVSEETVGVPLRRLIETYVLQPTTFPSRIAVIADRFPIQRPQLWHCYFRCCQAVYEAHLDLCAPVLAPHSGGRSDAQLRDMRTILTTILTISAEHLGSFPNRHILEDALRMCKQRHGTDGDHLSIGRGALATSYQTLGDTSATLKTSMQQTKRHTGHPPPVSPVRSAMVPEASPAKVADAGSTFSSIGRSVSGLSTTATLHRRLNRLEEPTVQFRVITPSVTQGDAVRIEWTLPTRVPPKYAAVGLFPAHEGSLLVLGNAEELHKGIRFRNWRGQEEFRAPMKSGKFIVAFFISPHSDSLPIEGMQGLLQIEPRHEHSGPLPKLRHEALQELAALPTVSVVSLPSTSTTCFIPCDSATSERARNEAMLRRAVREETAPTKYLKRPLPQLERSVSAMSLQAVSDQMSDAATLCCVKSHTPELRSHTSLTIFKHDHDKVPQAMKDGQERYLKSLRSIKSKLETQGTLVVLVGSAK
ncbi:Hypothetical protein, putative [Bodo saltans]|uniref:Clu domain-containing protein n=1 Tax=Bodo saltans TaxID=75058 RepID=A0A0S4J2D6_BODSA|nr:Hypothetical protein, putative [Bodo saltans]|eukprot:CUG83837.1 Hypothetical protein, putative [Bodo saltans]